MSDGPIPPEEWRAIVENVPLVSVDLVVEYDGGILLGKRENEPVKGEWFVPGGTVLKNERRVDAVHRVSREELGTEVTIKRKLGTYEHFYDASDVEGVDTKHYLASAYLCHFRDEEPKIVGDTQHSSWRVFPQLTDGLHSYVKQYFEEISVE